MIKNEDPEDGNGEGDVVYTLEDIVDFALDLKAEDEDNAECFNDA